MYIVRTNERDVDDNDKIQISVEHVYLYKTIQLYSGPLAFDTVKTGNFVWTRGQPEMKFTKLFHLFNFHHFAPNWLPSHSSLSLSV